MPKKNYYAVREGREPGIYSTWEKAKAQIDGFKNAVFRGFATENEARAFMQGTSALPTPSAAQPDADRGFVIYTDGSHIKGTRVRGIGAVCFRNGQEYALSLPCDDLPPEASNPTLELMAADAALRSVPDDCAPREITIVADYVGVPNYINGVWDARRSKAREFGAAARGLAERVAALRRRGFTVRARHVAGHTGVPGNERADRLAKAREVCSQFADVWKQGP